MAAELLDAHQVFCGARWNRTIGLSIIRAVQRAGQAIGTCCDLPFSATVSHQTAARATSFGHALGTRSADLRSRGHRDDRILEYTFW